MDIQNHSSTVDALKRSHDVALGQVADEGATQRAKLGCDAPHVAPATGALTTSLGAPLPAAGLTWGPPELEPPSNGMDEDMMDDAPVGLQWGAMVESVEQHWGESVGAVASRGTRHTHGGLLVPRSLLVSQKPAGPRTACLQDQHLLNSFL